MAYISKKMEDDLVNLIDWTKQKQINDIIKADDAALALFATVEAELIRLRRARKEQNKKTWNTIKERRKTDPSYCR